MILVDSSVWIDYFNGVVTPKTDKLNALLGRRPLAVGDLILTEVLQGFGKEKDFEAAKEALTSLRVITLGGEDIAVQAAVNFRRLREIGITVRKTIDSVIATRCIENGYDLLHDDKDFAPFVEHLGLREIAAA